MPKKVISDTINEEVNPEKSITEVLYDIQQALKVPKDRHNEFANSGKGFDYRNCEDILNAVKPLLPEGYVITLDDELVQIGDRYYVKAKALLGVGDFARHNTAYAREPESIKGMNASQITGCASSYARKYALSGLFGIGSEKDADSQNNLTESEKETATQMAKAKKLAEEVFNSPDTDKAKDDYNDKKAFEDDVPDGTPPASALPLSKETESMFDKSKGTISFAQSKRFHAMCGKQMTEVIKKGLLNQFGYQHLYSVKWQDYEELCKKATELNVSNKQDEYGF